MIPVAGGRFAVVTEYCKQGEIFDYLLAHKQLAESEARRLFRQLLSAVDYIHSLGFVHRDIKLENVLLDSMFHVKLADFGFARAFAGSNALRTSCGSPHYAAPEVLFGHEYRGPEIDIWSLGVLLYALLVGSMPYKQSTPSDLRAVMRVGTPYQAAAPITGLVKDLIDRMLCLEPRGRITMKELREHEWIVADGCAPLAEPFPLTREQIFELTGERELCDPEILSALEVMGVTFETDSHPSDPTRKWIISPSQEVTAAYCLVARKRHSQMQKQNARASRRLTEESGVAGGPSSASANTPASSPVNPAGLYSPRGPIPSSPRHPGGYVLGSSLNLNDSSIGRLTETWTAVTPARKDEAATGQARRSTDEDEQGGAAPHVAPAVGASSASMSITKRRTVSGALAPHTPALDLARLGKLAPRSIESERDRRRRPSTDSPQHYRTLSPSAFDASSDGGMDDSEDLSAGPSPRDLSSERSPRARPGELSPRGRPGELSPRGRPGELPPRSPDGLPRAHSITKPPSEKPVPRTVRTTVSSANTSARPADELLAELLAVLFSRGIDFVQRGFKVTCTSNDLQFTVELCLLPRLDMHSIRFARLAGDIWQYMQVVQVILMSIEL